MDDQPPPAAISSAFPAPPPFYKSFTAQNLESQRTYLANTHQPTSDPPPTAVSRPDLLSLPPELRNLFPPAPPLEGKYRSFGIEHDISPAASTESQISPTPARLQALTHNLLLSFLSLINLLATNPGAWAPTWDELHALFQEVHDVINGYRPHQARETLILMMEEQVEKVRTETKAVRESVGRARELIEGLGKEEGREGLGTRKAHGMQQEERKRRIKADGDKRVWEVLERELGQI